MPVGEIEEDDGGDIGELGEEIARSELNEFPIEKPKCLSTINLPNGLIAENTASGNDP